MKKDRLTNNETHDFKESEQNTWEGFTKSGLLEFFTGFTGFTGFARFPGNGGATALRNLPSTRASGKDDGSLHTNSFKLP